MPAFPYYSGFHRQKKNHVQYLRKGQGAFGHFFPLLALVTELIQNKFFAKVAKKCYCTRVQRSPAAEKNSLQTNWLYLEYSCLALGKGSTLSATPCTGLPGWQVSRGKPTYHFPERFTADGHPIHVVLELELVGHLQLLEEAIKKRRALQNTHTHLEVMIFAMTSTKSPQQPCHMQERSSISLKFGLFLFRTQRGGWGISSLRGFYD